jgi:hypothetical protein
MRKRELNRDLQPFPLFDLPLPTLLAAPPVEVALEKDSGTVLTIFDWDDTLCPTTWLDTQDEDEAELPAEFVGIAQRVLEVASKYGEVAVVTLAERSWLERRLSQYPSNFIGCPVYHARDYGCTTSDEPQYCAGRTHDESEAAATATLVAMKRAAMSAVVGESCYSQVISIGDGKFEALAVHDLIFDGGISYTKSVKLSDDPTVESLMAQLNVVAETFPRVVAEKRRLHLSTSKGADLLSTGTGLDGLFEAAPAA